MLGLLALPGLPEVANTYDEFSEPPPERHPIHRGDIVRLQQACSSVTSSGFNGSGLLDTRNQHLSQEPDNAAGVFVSSWSRVSYMSTGRQAVDNHNESSLEARSAACV